MDFVTSLAIANREFAERESMRIHPLRDTHINDVPVIAAELMAEACGEQNRGLELLRKENRVLKAALLEACEWATSSDVPDESGAGQLMSQLIYDAETQEGE